MYSRLLSLVALASASFGALPKNGIDVSNSLPRTSLSRLDAKILAQASVRLAKDRPGRVAQWLLSHRNVGAVRIGKDHRTLDIHFHNDFPAELLSSVDQIQTPGTAPEAAISRRRFRLLSSSENEVHTPSHADSPNARALVLEPFATELQLGTSAADIEVSDLQAAGYAVDQAYDTNVTVSTMATLSQYNVVYMHTHSGVNDLGQGVVATGEPANGDPSVAPYLANGTVLVLGVAGSTQLYYGITSDFLLKYEPPFATNSFWFLNGCSLLRGTVFWQAAASRGLGALVSWDQDSTSHDNYLSAAAFFAEMDQGMTIQGAIAAEKTAGYGRSTVDGTVANLGYLGNGQITLDSAKQPIGSENPTPTSTNLPLATSSATSTVAPPSTSTSPPTSTLIATPTTVPTVPHLSLSLKGRVEPGTFQVVAAHTSPGVRVLFSITFPNGDHLGASRIANVAGLSTYSFLQRASKISHSNLNAKVLVEAGNPGDTSQRTATYRIRWNTIDVSVEPREQTSGHTVTIWIHTKGNKAKVSAQLFGPGHSTLAKMRGSVNQRSWYHHSYRIKRGAPGESISVKAQVTLHNRVYRTKTTFTVT